MANLAIKGHATRGNEVVELLEMLGGKNDRIYGCNVTDYAYIIDEQGIIDWYIPLPDSPFDIFTLEEFLEKFPYKVGDKVKVCGDNLGVIISMRWKIDCVVYKVKLSKNGYETSKTSENLQPYKEETMDKVSKAVFDANAQCCDITNRLIKEETMEENEIIKPTTEINLNHPCFDVHNEIELIIPANWKFEQRGNKMFGVRKQYPKTYKECCDVLGLSTMDNDAKGYKDILIVRFQELLIDRDAYWKIAGEKMGLGEPWKPDWLNAEQDKFVLYTHDDVICLNRFVLGHNVLAFPTAEMRDAFLENFKKLIESCKELL